MLIVAIPKSGSSSLIKSLCDQHKIEDGTARLRSKYQRVKDRVKAYYRLSKWHSEIVDLPEGWASETQSKTSLFKHHFPPTEHNQKILKAQKIVILLRDPIDVVKSHFKGDQSGVFPLQSEDFLLCLNEESWIKKAEDIGLLQELQLFYDGWKDYQGEALILYYDDLVQSPLETCNKIEEFWDLKISSSVDFAREKYSSVQNMSQAQSLLFRLYRRLRVFAKGLLRPLTQHLYY